MAKKANINVKNNEPTGSTGSSKLALFGLLAIVMGALLWSSYSKRDGTSSERLTPESDEVAEKPRPDEPELPAERPRLTVVPMEVDFGMLSQREPREQRFMLTNRGNAGLKLAKIETTCSCLQPELSKFELEPGEKVELLVRLLTNVDLGRRRYEIMIRSDDPQSPEVRIPALVDVRPLLIATPPVVQFGLIKEGQRKEVTIPVNRSDGLPFTLVSAVSKSPDFKVLDFKALDEKSWAVRMLGEPVSKQWNPLGLYTGLLELRTELNEPYPSFVQLSLYTKEVPGLPNQ